MRKAALQLGIVDRPDGKLKKHDNAIPYLGGLAVFSWRRHRRSFAILGRLQRQTGTRG